MHITQSFDWQKYSVPKQKLTAVTIFLYIVCLDVGEIH